MPTIQKAGIDPLSGRDSSHIARAALPFFGLMLFAVLLLYAFPALVTFLPQHMKL